jgi:hypothetical protein
VVKKKQIDSGKKEELEIHVFSQEEKDKGYKIMELEK